MAIIKNNKKNKMKGAKKIMLFKNENCIEGMKELRSNSVNLIVADPPYLHRFLKFGKKS